MGRWDAARHDSLDDLSFRRIRSRMKSLSSFPPLHPRLYLAAAGGYPGAEPKAIATFVNV